MENNQTAARAAKRFLDERVRTDWSYPSLPPAWEHSDEEVSSAVGFRERYYGESESSDSEVEGEGESRAAIGREGKQGVEGGGEGVVYKFDSPDAVGDAVARRSGERRKRRKLRLAEEMGENEGLRIWVERRDVWTGVASVRKYGTRRAQKVLPPPTTTSPQRDSESEETTTTLDPTPAQQDADLTPVAPALLPTNPIRASITPKAYSDIYAKIVTSSRTPSVPINLSHMTRALVQGWKDTNEWPPKIGVVDPLAGRRRGAAGGTTGGGGADGEGKGGFIHRHPHLEKGVGSVRKIFKVGGHHGEG